MSYDTEVLSHRLYVMALLDHTVLDHIIVVHIIVVESVRVCGTCWLTAWLGDWHAYEI